MAFSPGFNDPANSGYHTLNGIPADNPFVNTAGAAGEIYANGFRNPYKFNFDPANGHLIEGDAGQNNVEEINIVTKGSNYGWPVKEGTFLFNRTGANVGTVDPTNSRGSPAGLTDPVLEYDHNDGSAIVGGFVYHGSLLPALDGKYIFGDFSDGAFTDPPNGRLFYADLATGKINEFALNQPLGMWVKGFGQDANNEIYVLTSTVLGPAGTNGQVLELVPEPANLSLLGIFSLVIASRRNR